MHGAADPDTQRLVTRALLRGSRTLCVLPPRRLSFAALHRRTSPALDLYIKLQARSLLPRSLRRTGFSFVHLFSAPPSPPVCPPLRTVRSSEDRPAPAAAAQSTALPFSRARMPESFHCAPPAAPQRACFVFRSPRSIIPHPFFCSALRPSKMFHVKHFSIPSVFLFHVKHFCESPPALLTCGLP